MERRVRIIAWSLWAAAMLLMVIGVVADSGAFLIAGLAIGFPTLIGYRLWTFGRAVEKARRLKRETFGR